MEEEGSTKTLITILLAAAFLLAFLYLFLKYVPMAIVEEMPFAGEIIE